MMQAQNPLLPRHCLAEIKRFTTYYATCLYHQKQVSEEAKAQKDLLNTLYHELLHSRAATCQMFTAILSVLQSDSSALWKGAAKTLVKMLSYPEVCAALQELSAETLILTLIQAKIEPLDHSEEEQKLLLKQKVLLKAVTHLGHVPTQSQGQVFEYLLKVVKKQIVDDQDQYYSLLFGDGIKKNLHKLVGQVMQREDVGRQVIERVVQKVRKNFLQSADIVRFLKEPMRASRLKEYLCFLLKTLEDSLKKLPLPALTNILFSLKASLFEVICTSAENEDLTIRAQAQQLFTFVLQTILGEGLPLREELEIALIKIVLKPAVILMKKLNKTTSSPETLAQKPIQEDGDEEHDDFIQVPPQSPQSEDLQLELSMNYVLETLLTLSPQQIAQLYLFYDCQPFSECLVTKAIVMLLKYSQSRGTYLHVFTCLCRVFKGLAEIDGGSGAQLYLMRENKSNVKRMVKDCNKSYKAFMRGVDEQYAYLEDPQVSAGVVAKVLAYSREVEIANVIQIIGGKDDKAHRIIKGYLANMDFSDQSIEHSMRRFLETFRLAGVDSQVITRIMQRFGEHFHDIDQRQIFASQEEAFDFAYLIIVLQTSQHNPNIKTKVDLKSFTEQALANCPKSKERIPEGFIEGLYNSVTNDSFFTPNTRSLYDEIYNKYNATEVKIRLSTCEEREDLTEEEFVNTADITKKQLFHYSNSLKAPPGNLVPLAQRQLINFLSTRHIKYLLAQPSEQPSEAVVNAKLQSLRTLIDLNKLLHNHEMVDKLFALMYKALADVPNFQQGSMMQQLETLLWENFDCLKRSLILLPKISAQSILREPAIQDTIQHSLLAVRRLIMQKYQYKKQERTSIGSDKSAGSSKSHPATAKQPSFFDLVYNYFTDNNEQEDQGERDKKEEVLECKAWADIKKALLVEVREGDYQQELEEKFEDKMLEQWSKQKQRLQELISLLCTQIRDNMNQEDGMLCLAFVQHLLRKSEYSVELLEKLWFECHLMLNQSLKMRTPFDAPLSTTTQSSGEKGGADYEVISSDTSVDSIDTQGGDFLVEILQKESNPMKLRVNEAINRHLILQLHLQLSNELIAKKGGCACAHIIKDVQKIMSEFIEENLHTLDGGYRLFDETLMLQSIQGFISEQAETLKTYHKTPKFLRLSLLLILKSQQKKGEEEVETAHQIALVQHQVALFHLIARNLSALPFDLVTLAVEVFSKLRLPTHMRLKNPRIQKVLEDCLLVVDSLSEALQKQHEVGSEAKEEAWLKLVQSIQEKLLLNPCTHAFGGLSLQVFNQIKSAVLSHPFSVSSHNYVVVKRLFSDILQRQSFDNLKLAMVKTTPLTEEEKIEYLDSDDGDESDANFKLEQICLIAVTNLSDVLIYYISAIFANRSESTEEAKVQTLSFLWLSLLKQLLDFAEKGHTLDLHGLVVCSHDNIKRVVEFMVQQEILTEAGNKALWGKTWDTIGAFFTDMKGQVVMKQ